MADVAARAGVSGQTVSRVVNASPRVDPATRQRVEAAMADLGYRPHRAARALRTGRTHTIGLLVSTLATVGNSRMLQAVADAAAARDFALTVMTLGAAGDADVSDAFARLAEQGVDGVVVLNEATAAAREARIPAGLRVVVVDAPPADLESVASVDASAPYNTVQTDHAAGARAAVDHLLDLGHATVCHVAGPADSFAAAQRERGWRDALTAHGSAVPGLIRGDWSAASGYTAAAAVVASGATAVFCANDQMALGLLRGVSDAGLDVPRDVSVVGFDDVLDAEQFRPPLTTVRQEFDRLGERAVAVLVDAIEQRDAGVRETVPTTLIVRESTAPPAAV
ncbi:LacI family DNA-binding transcriptional regulator [Microbacterium sp. C7(2022)]|uniref:LacI family DNA-binding transcriptional regulator n=1 Tax=Microbacterium sp. C7(2022) TaxID=2992759 RepID=UPI00237A80A9|nr:LacI family DNA-binding transcriptional regulator [Microbacterium sp. C7(2022)]MDE0546630.1 LacI family transcriptional regulator [Microbacterium sp. C7(2022)]